MLKRSVGLVALLALFAALFAAPPPAQAQSRLCFQQVPDCIEGRFAEFWQQNGGLPVFGLPKSAASQQQIEGRSYLVQQFERNRFELHPENARPYDVLLSRLGDELLKRQGRDWQGFPKVGGPGPGCIFYQQTGHSVCGDILNTYSSNGLEFDGRRGKSLAESLALFGLPLSEPQPETLSDGRQYTVQWFERARFELHPENSPPYNVLLGLLGNESQGGGGNLPPSVNASASPQRAPAGTTFTFSARGFQPGENIGVYITAPNQAVVGAPFQTQADGSGVSDEVTFSSPVDIAGGIYAITFEGVSSKARAVAYFEITGAAAPPPPPAGGIPASVNAAVEPNRGPRGTEFVAIARGFQPGESIGVYVTAPNQAVIGAPFQVGADSSGLSEPVTFRSSGDLPTGIYAITFEGVSSRVRGIAYFEVTP
ncbi:MAG: hypothetical protein H7Y32_20250 [Chloroflexales bacterium]|nr:hypothetical protein [Chloroflexales bacterium]